MFLSLEQFPNALRLRSIKNTTPLQKPCLFTFDKKKTKKIDKYE